MSSWRINAIETERAAAGLHEHISRVRVSNNNSETDGIWLSRQTVVNDIRSGGDDYYTLAGGAKAAVRVVGCPQCTFTDYLRTDRDATTADNLLSLPRA